MTKPHSIPLSPVILSLLIGAGQALAVLLALLPILVPDADVPRFLFKAAIASLVAQVLGLGLGVLFGTGRCTWLWVTRWLMVILTAALLWTYGWGPDSSTFLAVGLGIVFLLSACTRTITDLVLGLTFSVACFGVGHPLMLVDLVPAALGATWVLFIIRIILWLSVGLTGHTKDMSIVALVAGLFAPTVMLLGGWLGHDTALLTSAFITQFIGFSAARWVSRSITANY